MTIERSFTTASLVTLGLSSLFTFVALVQTAGFTALFTGNGLPALLLALSPYLVFCAACLLARRSGGRAIGTFVVCVSASVFAIGFYLDLAFLNPGSMNGLVFYFVPICQLAAATLLLALLLVVMCFSRPRRRDAANL